jgi:chromatin licensing and DNA replication factor 1
MLSFLLNFPFKIHFEEKHSMGDPETLKKKQRNKEAQTPSSEWEGKDVRTRKIEPHIAMNYRGINKKVNFPKNMQKLSKLFSVLKSINRFNKEKKLVSIFVKNKRCIENLLGNRIEIKEIEQLNYLLEGWIKFESVTILHEEQVTETFTYDIVRGSLVECDDLIWKYLMECYKKFLEEKGLDHCGSRLHPEFDIEKIPELPRKSLSVNVEAKNDHNREDNEREVERVEKRPVNAEVGQIKRGRDRANDILERIREKERVRKEKFIKSEKEKDNLMELRNKIVNLFRVEGKKAILIKSVVELLRIFKGKESISKVTEKYSEIQIKTLDDEEYLVYNGS